LAAAETTLGSAISAEAKQQAEGAKAQAAARIHPDIVGARAALFTTMSWSTSSVPFARRARLASRKSMIAIHPAS
jgi:hypothetical protein